MTRLSRTRVLLGGAMGKGMRMSCPSFHKGAKVENLKRSYTMVSSAKSNGKQRQQRASKEERRVLVKSFIEKYQSENNGKFPTISKTRTEIRGSYYVVRELVQEIIYKHKQLENSGISSSLPKQNLLTDWPNISQVESEKTSQMTSANCSEHISKLRDHTENQFMGTDDDQVSNCNESDAPLSSAFEVTKQSIKEKDIDFVLEPKVFSVSTIEPMGSLKDQVTREKNNECPLNSENSLVENTNQLKSAMDDTDIGTSMQSLSNSASAPSSMSEDCNNNTVSNADTHGKKLEDSELLNIDFTRQSPKEIKQSSDVCEEISRKSSQEGFISQTNASDKESRTEEIMKVGANETPVMEGFDGQKHAACNQSKSKEITVFQEKTIWDNLKSFAQGIFSLLKKPRNPES